MEIKYELRSADGKPVSGVIHNTIHELGDDSKSPNGFSFALRLIRAGVRFIRVNHTKRE